MSCKISEANENNSHNYAKSKYDDELMKVGLILGALLPLHGTIFRFLSSSESEFLDDVSSVCVYVPGDDGCMGRGTPFFLHWYLAGPSSCRQPLGKKKKKEIPFLWKSLGSSS